MAVHMNHFDHEERVIWYCIFLTGSLSLASSGFVMLSCAIFERLRTPTMRLVLLQTSAHVVLSLSYNVAFFNPPATGTFACNVQGFLINFSTLATSMCAALIAGYMMFTATRTKRVSLTNRNLALSALVITFVCTCMGLMPLLTDQYADLGARCWIAESEDGKNFVYGSIMRFASHYIPVWMSNLFIVYACVRVVSYLKEARAAQHKQLQRQDTNPMPSDADVLSGEVRDGQSISVARFTGSSILSRATSAGLSGQSNTRSIERSFILRTMGVLAFYPVICFLVWAPVSILRIITAIARDSVQVPLWLLAFTLALLGIQGFLFGLVFCQYRSVQDEWRRFFRRLCRPTKEKKKAVIMSDTPITATAGGTAAPAGGPAAPAGLATIDEESSMSDTLESKKVDSMNVPLTRAQHQSQTSARRPRPRTNSSFVARVFGEDFATSVADMDMPELNGLSFIDEYEAQGGDGDFSDSFGNDNVELAESSSRNTFLMHASANSGRSNSAAAGGRYP